MPLLDEYGEISEYIASRTDVTELIKKEQLIKAQFEDELTGLHSRGALLHDLLIEPDSYASLILINIDRFSDINDYFGYETGDELLRLFAKKLQNGHQKAYRISGDEFALLCEHELNDENRDEIASMLIDLETSEYQLFEESISIFLSCGVSYSKKRELYKLSHIALKKNKYSNEPVTYYNDFKDLENKIKENLDVILRIKEGLKHDRFVPFYQGIVDNKTKKILIDSIKNIKCIIVDNCSDISGDSNTAAFFIPLKLTDLNIDFDIKNQSYVFLNRSNIDSISSSIHRKYYLEDISHEFNHYIDNLLGGGGDTYFSDKKMLNNFLDRDINDKKYYLNKISLVYKNVSYSVINNGKNEEMKSLINRFYDELKSNYKYHTSCHELFVRYKHFKQFLLQQKMIQSENEVLTKKKIESISITLVESEKHFLTDGNNDDISYMLLFLDWDKIEILDKILY